MTINVLIFENFSSLIQFFDWNWKFFRKRATYYTLCNKNEPKKGEGTGEQKRRNKKTRDSVEYWEQNNRCFIKNTRTRKIETYLYPGTTEPRTNHQISLFFNPWWEQEQQQTFMNQKNENKNNNDYLCLGKSNRHIFRVIDQFHKLWVR